MSIVKISGADIRIVYFLSDIIVLILSLTYIDIRKIVYSLLTVVLSGQLIGFVSRREECLVLNKDKCRKEVVVCCAICSEKRIQK